MATILVLNGDQNTAALLTEFFEWRGDRTVLAASVSEAREWIEGGLVDLLVTERIVPWPGGEFAPVALGPACRRARVPILVWTADVLEQDRARIIDAGAGYLAKPASLEEIAGAVDALLSSKQDGATA